MEDDNFTIFSDAKSILQALVHFNPTNPLVLKILEWLVVIEYRVIRVEFCWVPAHASVPGNEEADKLTKTAAVELLPRRYPILHSDFWPNIRRSLCDIWQQRWDSVDQNKMREIKSVKSPWKYNFMSRRWETALCRLRIGHTRLTQEFLMTGRPCPYREDCLVPLPVKHLLVECPSLGDLRVRCLSEARVGVGGYILAKILGEDVMHDACGSFKYIVEAGVLHKI
ncbi:uncharacterized protein [Macrobrachium rosenbergii]|uniref:uncharacterized protein n=1 Tax=Macrobrachium rosenbergii TaxID=79674 RepID=UPI0034D6A521